MYKGLPTGLKPYSIPFETKTLDEGMEISPTQVLKTINPFPKKKIHSTSLIWLIFHQIAKVPYTRSYHIQI